ncbi:MAG: helix-turn-helix transcriptional regulator [Proteobacteria bacterium]|nr:helix-turn-helix transcriptional regulator [Burkholderiales bacterium]
MFDTSTPVSATRSVGHLLRDWRLQRRRSQMELALEVGVSTRHLSFLETGRAAPSRQMLLRLAEQLDLSLRGRNALLIAGGFAPMFRERALDDPQLQAARAAVDTILAGHEPHPALAVDRHWNLLAANRPVMHLLAGVDAALLEPPVNVLRLSLHPQGLAPRIVNLAEWRAHLLHRVAQQIDSSGDRELDALLTELRAYPAAIGEPAPTPRDAAAIAVPFRLRSPVGTLSFFSTTTVFGTPVDITLDELALECFFPADEATAAAMRTIAIDA